MSLLSWLRSRGYPEDLYLSPPCRGVTDTQSVFADPPATLHRPDAISQPSFRPGGACATVGCDTTATQIVARGLRHSEVCSKCSDEMTAFGWEWVGRI